ncbi:MAG: alpha-glucosidase [Chitinophagales bacterium]|nr:alpha-glucosidase [Chitinophagales bacterium]
MKSLYIAFIICFCYTINLNGAVIVPNLSIDVSQHPSFVEEVGSFIWEWNTDSLQLKIRSKDFPMRDMWSSLPGKGFLSAAIAQDKVEEQAGSFILEEEVESLLNQQQIQVLGMENGKFTIKGVVSNDTISSVYTIIFEEISEKRLNVRISFILQDLNRTYLTYSSRAEEHFYGFGEQCSFFDNKGKHIPVFVNEQGVGRGDITDPLINLVLGPSTGNAFTNYISVPHYITTDQHALFLENNAYSSFDLTEPDKVQINLWSGNMVANILAGNTPKELIETYTEYSGRMRSLPDWVHKGAIIGLQGGTEKLYEVWDDLRQYDVPISAFWVQDWVGQRRTLVGKQLWWNWELDNDRYPQWDSLLDSLENNGIRLMGYVNPFIANVYGQKDNIRRNLFLEALQNDFLVKTPQGKPYYVQNTSFDAGIIDLTNPACREWMKNVIKDELIARGLKGWMADFGEALPYDAVLYSGEPAATYHNIYTTEWAKINREAIEECGYGDEIVFFMRSGHTQSPEFATLFWQGDQLVDWGQNDGIKSAVTGLLSAGISGFTLNHSDIGGYTTVTYPIVQNYVRSKELLMRWIEMSAFTTAFRTHEGLNPDRNKQVYDDAELLQHFSDYAKVYAAWDFYRKQLVDEANKDGIPVVRHPYLEFPDDTATYNIYVQQFMVGSELMVAPVLDKNTLSVNIYLPKGVWVNLWDGTTVTSTGESFVINELSDRPAVFFKEASSIGIQFRENLIALGLAE